MMTFLIILHVVVSIALILIVLLQSGKGADMGAAFGGSAQTVFGATGPAPLLGKITTVAAVVFMVTSLSLAYFSSNPMGGSIADTMEKVPVAPPVATTPPVQATTGSAKAAKPAATAVEVKGKTQTAPSPSAEAAKPGNVQKPVQGKTPDKK